MIDRQCHPNFEYTTSFSINSYLVDGDKIKAHTTTSSPSQTSTTKHPLYIVFPSLLRNSTQESRLLHRPAFRVYILSHALHFSFIATMRLSALPFLLFSAAVYGQSGRKQFLDSMNLLSLFYSRSKEVPYTSPWSGATRWLASRPGIFFAR